MWEGGPMWKGGPTWKGGLMKDDPMWKGGTTRVLYGNEFNYRVRLLLEILLDLPLRGPVFSKTALSLLTSSDFAKGINIYSSRIQSHKTRMSQNKAKLIPGVNFSASRRSRSPRARTEPAKDHLRKTARRRSPSFAMDPEPQRRDDRSRKEKEKLKEVKQESHTDQDPINIQLDGGIGTVGANQETTDQGFVDEEMDSNVDDEDEDETGEEEDNTRDINREHQDEAHARKMRAFQDEPVTEGEEEVVADNSKTGSDEYLEELDDSPEGLINAVQKKHHIVIGGRVIAYRSMGQGKYQCLVQTRNHNGATTYRMKPAHQSPPGWDPKRTPNIVQHQRGNKRNEEGQFIYNRSHIKRILFVAWQPNHKNPLQTIHPYAWLAINNPPQVYCGVGWHDDEITYETRTSMRRLFPSDEKEGKKGGDLIIYARAEDQEHRWIGIYSGIKQFYKQHPLKLLTSEQQESLPRSLPTTSKPARSVSGEQAALKMQAAELVQLLQKQKVAREKTAEQPVGMESFSELSQVYKGQSQKAAPEPLSERRGQNAKGKGLAGPKPAGKEFPVQKAALKLPTNVTTTSRAKLAAPRPEFILNPNGNKVLPGDGAALGQLSSAQMAQIAQIFSGI